MKPTRKEYLSGSVTHREFYGSVVNIAWIRFTSDFDIVKRALASTDEHLNDIPLSIWDQYALDFRAPISRSLEEHGDSYSLAGGVCTIKEAVRQAVERIKEREVSQ